ncbi:MAG: hypothetical protein ACRCYU_03200 [Nocardioides sp.]
MGEDIVYLDEHAIAIERELLLAELALEQTGTPSFARGEVPYAPELSALAHRRQIVERARQAADRERLRCAANPGRSRAS